MSTTLHVAIVTDEDGWTVFAAPTRREMFQAVSSGYVCDRVHVHGHDEGPIEDLAERGFHADAVEAWFEAVESVVAGWAGLDTTCVAVPSAARPCTLGVLYAEADERDGEDPSGPWHVFAGATQAELYDAIWSRFIVPHPESSRLCKEECVELAGAGRFREAVETALEGGDVGHLVEFRWTGSAVT